MMVTIIYSTSIKLINERMDEWMSYVINDICF